MRFVLQRNENRVVTARLDQRIKIWDVDSGREVLSLKGHRRPVTLVQFSPRGQLLSGTGVDFME